MGEIFADARAKPKTFRFASSLSARTYCLSLVCSAAIGTIRNAAGAAHHIIHGALPNVHVALALMLGRFE